uniref:Jacalin-related lectin 16 n=1 Tax=Arabidopsis thaliana TaxID=3702 RepID=JAL16_ARATH|nr:RecName: Full=Jacalin-related lectin 16 [Arabidopsis thaliana]AAC24045.1 Similar to jasmonate inducible protein gb/Y11483 from Brassica napus [Arabidopsis thaliana]
MDRSMFEIDHKKDEQLVSVEGYCKPGSDLIQGVQFKTNLRISEIIGFEKAIFGNPTTFSLAEDGKKIIGFHGYSMANLNSLGAYFTWISPTKMEAKGGKGGTEWNDGAEHEGFTKIYVQGGCDGIQYIKFDYVKDGQHKYGSPHGVKGSESTEPFEINHLDKEYLISVEGYYDEGDSGVIQGIQFKTNIKTSELIGDKKGRKFSLAANGKKIIGFHGYADKNLNSLGAYFTTSPLISLEHTTGSDLVNHIWDDGSFEGVRKVYVRYDSLEICYVEFDYDNKGKVEKREHGMFYSWVQQGEFVVDYPNEFITSVEGTMRTESFMQVASLTFKTSKGRTSSTFGSPSDSKFLLESKGCGVVGFYGRCFSSIFDLGAYFRPLPPPSNTEKVEAKGGDGGASWDDGGFDGIRNIYIGHNKMGIAFVKFLYDKDSQIVVGDDHGSNTLLRVDEFELEHPGEYLISVEGSYDVVDGSESEVIRMLRFKTNLRTSQLFGHETTPSFILEKECHKIVGFHGKIGKMLHQIGVNVLPITD